VLAKNRIRPRGMEHSIHDPDRLVHGVGNGQLGVGDLMARVRCSLTNGLPCPPHGLHHIGPGGAEDRFGLGDVSLEG
jgi:hypothetical protein